MKILVTGSSGHLGHALTHTLSALGHQTLGIDIVAAPWTQRVGSIIDRAFVRECMRDVEAVVHAATLHKPHVTSRFFPEADDDRARRDTYADANLTIRCQIP